MLFQINGGKNGKTTPDTELVTIYITFAFLFSFKSFVYILSYSKL